jgi:hypothetical protein
MSVCPAPVRTDTISAFACSSDNVNLTLVLDRDTAFLASEADLPQSADSARRKLARYCAGVTPSRSLNIVRIPSTDENPHS